MKVEWREYLSVGVEEIDSQHKLLFEKYNALLAACAEERAEAEVQQLFGFLDEYVASHFASEERLQLQCNYPEYQKHRDQHLAFSREVASFKVRLREEGPTRNLVAAVSRFMTGWLIEHISGMDRPLGRFVKELER
jgi:hemerythrin